MNATVGKILALLLRGSSDPVSVLDGFVDSLLQTFENCRVGLTDEVCAAGGEAAERFFTELYEKEVPRLLDTIRLEEPHLTPEARQELFGKVDDLVRKVVLPAYVRLAVPYTRKERNDFYAAPGPLHLLERLGWCAAGMALGAFVVWAPFIPIWSKEWVFPFAVGGLFFPNIRRFVSKRRYEAELNRLVGRTDREIARIDTAYLTSAESLGEREAGAGAARLRTAAAVKATQGGS